MSFHSALIAQDYTDVQSREVGYINGCHRETTLSTESTVKGKNKNIRQI